jgi:hypothetical protein
MKLTPDYVYANLTFSGVSTSPNFDNRPSNGDPCAVWTLDYSAEPSVTSLTITIEGAPDDNGAPGAFAVIATSSVFPSAKVNFYTSTGYYPWMRVAITAVGGVGAISATLCGYRDNPGSITSGGGGGGGGTSSAFGTPFPADGTAAGAYQASSGDMEPLNLDSSGNLLVAGSLTITPTQSNTVSTAGPTTVGTSSTQLLAANAARKRLILQNVGTTKIWILFGAGSASSSNYHIALPAGGTTNDGSSPIYVDTMWTGAIQAISSAAGGSVVAEEFT